MLIILKIEIIKILYRIKKNNITIFTNKTF